jgi:lipopolysaccharide export system permease protein
MILTRYIIRQMVLPFLASTMLLIIIYAIYSTSTLLTDAASGDLQPGIILHIIYLSIITVLDVILPTALFFSVIYSLSRLYRDSEMVILTASGVSELRILIPIFYLSLTVALVVMLISTVCRPWAFRMTYALEAQAMAELEIETLQAGRFIRLEHSNHVLFASDIDPENSRLLDVYLQTNDGTGITRIIRSETMHLPRTGAGITRPVEFVNGHLYLLDRQGVNDNILQFRTLTLLLAGGIQPVGYKRKAENTFTLAQSDKPRDSAEFQKRLSVPVITILLALLAVPISRITNRQGSRLKKFLAIIVYTLVFNITSIVRTWVEQGILDPVPGVWLVPFLLTLVLAAMLYLPYRARHSPGR